MSRVLIDIILIRVVRLNIKVRNVVSMLDKIVVIIGIFVLGWILVRNL